MDLIVLWSWEVQQRQQKPWLCCVRTLSCVSSRADSAADAQASLHITVHAALRRTEELCNCPRWQSSVWHHMITCSAAHYREFTVWSECCLYVLENHWFSFMWWLAFIFRVKPSSWSSKQVRLKVLSVHPDQRPSSCTIMFHFRPTVPGWNHCSQGPLACSRAFHHVPLVIIGEAESQPWLQ